MSRFFAIYPPRLRDLPRQDSPVFDIESDVSCLPFPKKNDKLLLDLLGALALDYSWHISSGTRPPLFFIPITTQ